MSNRCLRFVIAASFLSTSMLASGAEVVVTLSPSEQVVKPGETPRFFVTVRATTTSQRVMKFAERDDLKDSYARLIVTRNGSPVEVPRVISDPGPTRDVDYIELRPGESIRFEHRGMPYLLSQLAPGSYSAVVKLQTDWRSAAAISNSVSFRVDR